MAKFEVSGSKGRSAARLKFRGNDRQQKWSPKAAKIFFETDMVYCLTVMQIKLFTILIGESGAALQEMNAFLKAHKILEVEQQLTSNKNGASWCFCVRYVEQSVIVATESRVKVDYRQVLDEPTFQKFSLLRGIRKQAAATEGISAFIVFTDEELAELAKLEEITIKSMLGIKGIGEKKVERYAHYFMTKPESNETTGKVT